VSSNPLQDGLRLEPTPGPAILVIFGATGDLTKRKLLPALYHLSKGQRLPARFSVLGVGRESMPDDRFRGLFRDSLREFADLPQDDEVARSLAERMHYVGGDFRDGALFQQVKARLAELDGGSGALFYLAIPPGIYSTVIEQLGAAIKEAKAAPEDGGPIVIHIESDPLLDAPSSESWWDVPVSQVSELESTKKAFETYTDHKSRQRKLLG